MSKAFNLYLVMRSHLLPREKHGNLRKEIDELGPFHIVTQDSFASGIVDNTNSKRVKLAGDLQASDAQIGRAAFLRSLVTPTALLVWARELWIAIAAVAAVHALRGLHGNLTAPVADESLEP